MGDLLFCINFLYYFLNPNNFFNEWPNIHFEKFIKIFFLIRFPLLVILLLYLAKNENNVKYFRFVFIILSLLLFLLSIDIIFQFIFKIDFLE